jgi:WD40 repeat protein
LTHDNISYQIARYFPGGRQLLAAGIEPGHGTRDYLIDLATGDSKAITPEGISGPLFSPDGKNIVANGPDGRYGIWPLDGGGLRPIPGDGKYYVIDWTPDGTSLYVVSTEGHERTADVYRLNPATGKMDFFRKFGESLPLGSRACFPIFSADGKAYIYGYQQVLSEAYVVRKLR